MNFLKSAPLYSLANRFISGLHRIVVESFPPLAASISWLCYANSAYCVIIWSLFNWGASSLKKRWSNFASSQVLFIAIRPTMHPMSWFSSLRMSCICSTVVNPPFMTNCKWGNVCFNLKTQSYLSGGMFLFYLGSNPLKNAFLAWIMNFYTPPFSLTVLMKCTILSQESRSSTPNLHFTVTGILTFYIIAWHIVATSSGSNIS